MDGENGEDSNDFTLTQEELADDVRWEELKACSDEPTNTKKFGSAQLPSRSSTFNSSLSLRGIKKSSKTGSKSSKRHNAAGSIEDIIGILGKRKCDPAPPAVEKEHLNDSQNDRTLSQLDVLSATDTLTSDDIGGGVEPPENTTIPIVPAQPNIAAASPVDDHMISLSTQELVSEHKPLSPEILDTVPDQPESVSILARTQSLPAGKDNPLGLPAAIAGYGYVSTGTARPTQVNPVDSDSWMGGAAIVDGSSSSRFNPSTSSSGSFIALQQHVNQTSAMGPPTVLGGTAAAVPGTVMNRTPSAGNYNNHSLTRNSGLVPAVTFGSMNPGPVSNTSAPYRVNTSAAAMPRIAPVGSLTKPSSSYSQKQQQQSGYAPNLPLPATSTGYGKSSIVASSYSSATASSSQLHQPPQQSSMNSQTRNGNPTLPLGYIPQQQQSGYAPNLPLPATSSGYGKSSIIASSYSSATASSSQLQQPPQQSSMNSQTRNGSPTLPQGYIHQQHPVRIPSSNMHHSAQSGTKSIRMHQQPSSTCGTTVNASSIQYSSALPTSTGYASSMTVPVIPAANMSHTALSTGRVEASVSGISASKPSGDDFELSEEDLAQLLALEKSATSTASVPVSNAPAVLDHPQTAAITTREPSMAVPQNTIVELSEDDLSHLIAHNDSIQAQGLQASSEIQASVIEASTGQSQIDDFELSEEMLAQLMEVEQKAVADLTQHTEQQGLATVPNIQTAITPRSSPLKCMRLVALDVVDNPAIHVREVRAFQPGVRVDLQSNDGTNNPATGSGASGRHRAGAGVVDDMIIVELTGDWYSCAIVSGDIFHVVDLGFTDDHASASTTTPLSVFTELQSSNRILVSNDRGLVIVHPDVLISPTKVAESRSCLRRVVLTDRIRSFGDLSAPAVMGNLKHAYIEALTDKVLEVLHQLSSPTPSGTRPALPSLQAVRARITQTVLSEITSKAKASLLEDLYLVGCSDETVTADLAAILEPTLMWVYAMHTQGIQAMMRESKTGPPSSSNTAGEDIFLTGVVSAEESLCSAVLGMKGQIDLVARARLLPLCEPPLPQGHAAAQQLLSEVSLPVEIKTGKWRPSTAIGHRAQVMLYVLMMAVRERSFPAQQVQSVGGIPKQGVILYVSPDELKVDMIKPSWMEMRALMLSRNKLAGYVRDAAIGISSSIGAKSPLPPLLRDAHECQYCYQAAECVTYHASLESGTATSSGISEIFQYVLRDVTTTQLRYYKHWDDLLNLEAAATQGDQGLLRHHTDHDKTLRKLRLQTCVQVGTSSTYSIVFGLLEGANGVSEETAGSLSPGVIPSLSIGDRVQVSVETAAIRGTSRGSSASVVSAGETRDIEDIGLQSFRSHSQSLMTTETNLCAGMIENISPTEVQVLVSEDPRRLRSVYLKTQNNSSTNTISPTFRLDKDEISINITTMRSNLLALFVNPFQPKVFQQKQLSARSSSSTLPLSQTNKPTSDAAAGSALSRVAYRTASSSSLTSMTSASTAVSNNDTATSNNSQHVAEKKSNKHWRHLIVDLLAPSFRPPGTLQDDILLLKPVDMHPSTFQQALRMLYQYQQQGGSSLQLSKQQLTQLGIPYNTTTPGTTNGGGMVCVSRGKAGELNVFGGLTVYPGCHPFALRDEFQKLNIGQAAAVRKILFAEDYALLLGLPGTGKTSTLSLVIRMMLARGQKVLLTSFTHSAVDNLLVKLAEAGVATEQVLRIGNKTAVHPSMHKFLLESKTTRTSIAELQMACSRVRLVACTVLTAARNKLVRSLSLDCCLMDEAGQIAQPAALGAVLCARTAVLVGDDYQLPPLVVSLEAQSRGMNISLFKRFMEAHPAAVCSLTIQYRMNREIMSVCNTLIYEHRMQCALPSVAEAVIHLPWPQNLPVPRSSATISTSSMPQPTTVAANLRRTDWLYTSLQPRPAVVFLNTDSLACHRSSALSNQNNNNTSTTPRSIGSNRHSISSSSEAAVVCNIILALKKTGYNLQEIGIICPFRAQVGLISSSLLQNVFSIEESRLCEVSTVDKYQGRDKEIIILSTVKCCLDDKDSVGNLLRDWRRINVAVTSKAEVNSDRLAISVPANPSPQVVHTALPGQELAGTAAPACTRDVLNKG